MAPADHPRDLSESESRALENAIATACKAMVPLDADNEIADPHARLWPTLLDTVRRTALQHVQNRNAAKAPIARLSVEVLHMIFELLLLPDRVAVSRTCHTWREVSKTSLIVVPADPSEKPEELACMLWATEPALICFMRLVIKSPHSSALGRCIGDHMGRIRVLNIELAVTLRTALSQRAPQLQTLRVQSSNSRLSELFAEGFLNSDAPQLETIFSRCFAGLRGTFSLCCQFKDIRKLFLYTRIGWEEIETLFATFPQLEVLSLDLIKWIEGGQVPDAPLAKPPRLCIMSRELEYAARVLRAVLHSHITLIIITMKRGFREGPAIPFQGRGVLNMIRLLSPTISSVDISCQDATWFQMFSIRVGHPNNRFRMYHGIGQETLQDVLACLPNTTVSFSCSHTHILKADCLKMPASVRAITLIRSRRSFITTGNGNEVLWWGAPPLQFSRLDCFSIALRREEFPLDRDLLVVQACEVKEYLRGTLQSTSQRRLPCLRLQGVAVDDFSVLRDCADEIRVEPPLCGYVLPEKYVVSWSNWDWD